VDKGVLAGCRVLLTRPADQAATWRTALQREGAVVVDYPTIMVGPPPSWDALDSALERLHSYDWLVFSSATVVSFVADRWPSHIDRATLSRPLIAAVGDATTRALQTRGFRVALVPDDQRQEGLVAGLVAALVGAEGRRGQGRRVLFPRALGGRDHLVTALADQGIEVDLVAASRTVPVTPLPPLPDFDVATFASPSALDAFVDQIGVHPLQGGVVVVGATTAAAASARGIRAMVARAPDIHAVIDAIADRIARPPGGPG
jgi:uroporphyrinogen-III synthase